VTVIRHQDSRLLTGVGTYSCLVQNPERSIPS
jgi:hypothetical protein